MKKAVVTLLAVLFGVVFVCAGRAYATEDGYLEDPYTRIPSFAAVSGKEYELLDVF